MQPDTEHYVKNKVPEFNLKVVSHICLGALMLTYEMLMNGVSHLAVFLHALISG
jgi:hypothetical protein